MIDSRHPHEANLRPRVGDRIRIDGKDAEWKSIPVENHLLDFNALLGRRTEWSVPYAVCYVHSDKAQTGLLMKIGSDDQAKVYLNGQEIYRRAAPRSCVPDEDAVPEIALKAGLNVLVFKVVNEIYDWQGPLRLTDAAGLPPKGIQVTLEPEAND